MANISAVDMRLIDQLFDMGSGWVLDFSNRTFSDFFLDELNIDINNPAYEVNGTSKAKRLRTFLQAVDKPTVIRTLHALWAYRRAINQDSDKQDQVQNAEGRFLELINRLEGRASTAPPAGGGIAPSPAIDLARIAELKGDLLAVANLAPQPRGYAFEAFLTKMFNAHGLVGRAPFRLIGEQIDGSFQLSSETYLVEAKWHQERTGAADLHVFHGKIEQKAAWSRGLFISNSGFTEEGLHAFGRAKRLVCMDGLDMWDMLDRQIPLNVVLERKIRCAAETGEAFARVRDLFTP